MAYEFKFEVGDIIAPTPEALQNAKFKKKNGKWYQGLRVIVEKKGKSFPIIDAPDGVPYYIMYVGNRVWYADQFNCLTQSAEAIDENFILIHRPSDTEERIPFQFPATKKVYF